MMRSGARSCVTEEVAAAGSRCVALWVSVQCVCVSRSGWRYPWREQRRVICPRLTQSVMLYSLPQVAKTGPGYPTRMSFDNKARGATKQKEFNEDRRASSHPGAYKGALQRAPPYRADHAKSPGPPGRGGYLQRSNRQGARRGRVASGNGRQRTKRVLRRYVA